MTAPGSPTLEATTSQASRASSPHAPRFLSTLSPRKSAASTTTVSVTAATPRTQGQHEDAASTTGGAAMSRSTSVESSVSGLPGSPSEDLSLSMRIGSAMNAQFPTLASLEAAPAATVSGSDSQAKGEVGKGKAVQRDDLPSTPQETTRPTAEDQAQAQPSSSTSPWAWTSRAATGSMSFFKQGADAAATGLGSALRTNPFRNLSGAFGGEGASSTQEAAGPSASASTSKPGTAPGLPDSSARRVAAPTAKEADEDEDDDANLVRSAADLLRLGAKNEEKRRRRVQEHTRNQERRQQSKAATSKATPSTDGGPGPASSLFASAGSFLLPLRREPPSTSRSASPAPPAPPPQASNSSGASATSAAPTDINYFDFPTSWPEAERPPSPTFPLPSRRYFVLTQAGKPVFLSHLAQRRLAREDAARARLRAAREAQRRREERLADPAVAEEEKSALLGEEEQSRLSEEEARKLEAQQSDRDEEDAAIQVGVLQALVSNFSSHGPQHLESKSIEILKLPAKSSRVIFLLREPLYLAVTSTWHGAGYLYEDAETTLRGHLEVLYAGIVSLISEAQLKRLFARGHNFDLRRMLEGTDGIVESLVARMQTDFGLSLGAGGGGVCLRPMRVDLRVREDLNACLSLEAWERRPLGKALAAAAAAGDPNGEGSRPSSSSTTGKAKPLDPTPLLTSRQPPRPKDLIYVLLITPDLELVTLVRPRRLSAYPLDLHLLINMVAGMSRRGQREAGTVNWVPICLPRFAPQGMVQAHISWLKVGSGSGNGEGGGAGAAAANGDTAAAARHSRAASSSSTVSQRTGSTSSPCALVIVSADRESFDEISRYRDYILSLLSLPSTTLPKSPSLTSHTSAPSPITSLHSSLPLTRIAPDSLHLPGLWHFVLKKKDDLQVVWSEWLVDGYTGEGREAVLARERVTRAYERCREVCVLRAKGRVREGKAARRRKKEKAEAEAKEKEKEKAEVKEKEQAAAPTAAAAGGDKEGGTAREGAEEPDANEAGKVPAIVVAGEEGEDDGALRLATTPVNGGSGEGEGEDGEDASNGETAGDDIPTTATSAASSPTSLLPPPPPSPLAPPTTSSTITATSSSSPSSSSNSYTYYLRTTHEAIYVDCPPSSASTTSSTAPVSSPYEIYLTLSPHVPPATAKRIARAVLLWGLGEGSAAERSGGGGEGGAPRGERWRLWLGRGGSVL